MSHAAIQRLKALEQLNSNREWKNRDLYRLMYKEDLYVLAYERIKSKPGNMTPGTDLEMIDGFSMDQIREIIQQLRDQSFQFKPVRRVLIPRSNGKMRKLGIPSTRDKIVQEVMRMILQAIYDSPENPYFSDASHGFRPGRSCHTALREFREKWSGVNWIIEGDIRACFDEIDHDVLENILRKKITDERFINLVRKLLSAGYMDIQGPRKDSLAGTPQGGIVSPILANICLDELDSKVEEIRQRRQKGKTKRKNPVYRKLTGQRLALFKKEGTSPEIRKLTKIIHRIPAMDTNDPNFVRIKYLRYADDWIIGIHGSHQLVEEVKEEIRNFLRDTLKLTLSDEKTHITNARTEEAIFLGTRLKIGRGGEQQMVITTNKSGRRFKRRSTGWQTVMRAPADNLVQQLAEKGFCTKDGHPVAKRGWANLDVDQILMMFSGISRGYQNYYRFTDNFTSLLRTQYILQFSCAKTLGMKLKRKSTHILKRHGKELTFKIPVRDGKPDRLVRLYLNKDWKTKRNAFSIGDSQIDLVQTATRMRTRSKLDKPCCICGETDKIVMHHVRHIRKAGGKPPTGFNAIMRALNRKQLPVCELCHAKIHRGQYDGLKP